MMGSGLKNFGIISGIIAFVCCVLGGIILIVNGDPGGLEVGLIAIGFGTFAGASLILGVLRDQPTAKQSTVLAKSAKPAVAKKAAPAKTTAKGTPAAKPATAKAEGSTSIYAGSLPYEAGESEIRAAFEAFGTVASVRIVVDKPTGRSKGYGFVEMPVKQEALAAIEGLNGREFGGKTLKVNEAKPTNKRPRGRRVNNPTPEKREAEMVDWDS
ncbi:MAG: RNA-binding protein [Anaerohalosphaera sp.]|nr:RNA-binding protein [Anaerohalosphaera sp.]